MIGIFSLAVFFAGCDSSMSSVANATSRPTAPILHSQGTSHLGRMVTEQAVKSGKFELKFTVQKNPDETLTVSNPLLSVQGISSPIQIDSLQLCYFAGEEEYFDFSDSYRGYLPFWSQVSADGVGPGYELLPEAGFHVRARDKVSTTSTVLCVPEKIHSTLDSLFRFANFPVSETSFQGHYYGWKFTVGREASVTLGGHVFPIRFDASARRVEGKPPGAYGFDTFCKARFSDPTAENTNGALFEYDAQLEATPTIVVHDDASVKEGVISVGAEAVFKNYEVKVPSNNLWYLKNVFCLSPKSFIKELKEYSPQSAEAFTKETQLYASTTEAWNAWSESGLHLNLSIAHEKYDLSIYEDSVMFMPKNYPFICEDGVIVARQYARRVDADWLYRRGYIFGHYRGGLPTSIACRMPETSVSTSAGTSHVPAYNLYSQLTSYLCVQPKENSGIQVLLDKSTNPATGELAVTVEFRNPANALSIYLDRQQASAVCMTFGMMPAARQPDPAPAGTKGLAFNAENRALAPTSTPARTFYCKQPEELSETEIPDCSSLH